MTGRTGNTWLRALAALACAGLLMAAAVDSGIAKAKAPPAPASATSGDDGDMPQDAGSGDDTGGDDMDGPGSDEPVDAGAEGGGASQIDKSGGPDVPIDVKAPPVAIRLSAHLTEKGPELAKGLTWRIFDPAPKADGKLKLVGETKGGSVSLMLRPGTYFVHVAYGRAGATRKITAGRDFSSDLILNAGGMRLMAMVGKDQPLSAGDVTFSIYAPEEDGAEERAVVVANAPAGRIIGLNAGTYHVVCKYGDANAIVRADIHVEPGKLTEAAMYQKAARLTLKLVAEHGGEALANTAWSVVTSAGETVAGSVGAFPSVVLAAGEYTAIAKHDGKIYERTFSVEPGLNRDMEVIASAENIVPPVPPGGIPAVPAQPK
ncbi:MAG: hypothetical protein J0H94_20775 [Rhizobiales bacterium]|nr:hypothetical protein [Hyphomicrobiales bacterium]